MIDDATTDQDLRIPPSNHFEKLRGGLHGLCSIRVNKQWRMIFRWDGSRSEAEGIHIEFYKVRYPDLAVFEGSQLPFFE